MIGQDEWDAGGFASLGGAEPEDLWTRGLEVDQCRSDDGTWAEGRVTSWAPPCQTTDQRFPTEYGNSQCFHPGPAEIRGTLPLTRHEAARRLQKLTDRHGVRCCGMPAFLMQARDQMAASSSWNPEVDVPVKMTPEGAEFGGVFACKARWGCLRCDVAAAARDAEVLARMVRVHVDGGGGILFLTGTFPHDACDSLERGIEAVAGGWRYLRQGRAKKAADALGMVGYVRGLDLTVDPNHSGGVPYYRRSGGSGWHPHVHALLFMEREPTASEVKQIHRVMFDRWRGYVTQQGYRTPSAARFQLEKPRSAGDAARYVAEVSGSQKLARAKLAREVVGTAVKSGRVGRTLTEICFAAAAGEVKGVAQFREAEAALKRRKLLTFSQGYVAGLRRDAVEAVEAEAAAAEAEDAAAGEATDFYLPLWFYLGVREAPGGMDDFDKLVKDAARSARDGPPRWRMDYWGRAARDLSGTALGGLLATLESLWPGSNRRTPPGYYEVSAGLLRAAVRELEVQP